jgi:hydrogenase nickel incorporation protein HypA/HybF
MHELSIALSIVDMALEESRRRGGVRIEAIHLRLGELSGVVSEALLFSYEVACRETLLEGSQLIIEPVPVEIYCSSCKTERVVASVQCLCCPVCGALSSEVVRGKELLVVSLELADLDPLEEGAGLAERPELQSVL